MWPSAKDIKKYATRTGIANGSASITPDDEGRHNGTSTANGGLNRALNSVQIDDEEDEVTSLIDELSRESKIKKDQSKKGRDQDEDDDETKERMGLLSDEDEDDEAPAVSSRSDPRTRTTGSATPSKTTLKVDGPHSNNSTATAPIITITDPSKRATSITNAPLPKSPSVQDKLSTSQYGSGMPKSPSQPDLSSTTSGRPKAMTNAPISNSHQSNSSSATAASRVASSVSSWWNYSTGKSPNGKKGVTPTKEQMIEEMKKKILGLEEELKMGDNFKRSMRETLGLQIDALQMELQLERDKVKRLESELFLRQHEENKVRRGSDVVADINAAGSSASLVKLIQILAEEKKQSQQLEQSKDKIEHALLDSEKKIQDLFSRIKEETLFLQGLKEEKTFMEQTPNYQYQGTEAEIELGAKVAKTETTLKCLNEDVEKERRMQEELRRSIKSSVVDEKLDIYIALHEDLIDSIQKTANEGKRREETITQLQIQLEETKKNLESQKEFQVRLQQTVQQLELLQQNNSDLSKERDRVFQQLSDEQESSTAKEREYQQERAKWEESRTSLMSKLKEVEQQRDLHQTTIQQLESQLKQLTDEKVSLVSKLEEEKGNVAKALQSEKDELLSKMKKMEKEKADLTTTFAGEKESLHQQITSLQTEKQHLQSKIDSTTLINESLTKEIEKERSSFHSQLESAQAKNQQLQTHLQEVEAQRTTLESSLRDLTTKRDQLQSQLEESQQQYKQSQEQLASTQNQLEKEQSAKTSLQKELDSTNSKLSEAQANIQSLETSSGELKAKLEETSTNWRTEVEKLNGEISQHQQKILELVTEREELLKRKNKLEKLYNTFKAMTSEIET